MSRLSAAAQFKEPNHSGPTSNEESNVSIKPARTHGSVSDSMSNGGHDRSLLVIEGYAVMDVFEHVC